MSITTDFHSDRIFTIHSSLEIFSGNLSELENLRSSSFQGVYMSTSAAISEYNMRNFRKGHILMADDKVLLLPYSIFFRKHSCLVNAINWEINKYTSNGLISRWTSDLTHEKQIKEVIRNEQLQMQTPKKISLQQIRGVFIICALMYLISGVVFVMELLTVKFEFIRVLFDFCTFQSSRAGQ